ncbi:TetR family transcriptional regulator [Alcanivorax sp. N3-2A]|nr:TetR family transcriptional regulator [Alcanivorax sp. N3-2A]
MSPTTPSPSARGSSARGSPARGRPKDPAKRAAILEAAKELFLRDGYVGTSMDAVAAAAGVSKLTVYSHFSDKPTLFSAAVESKCEEMLPSFAVGDDYDLATVLQHIGQNFVDVINSAEAVGLRRLMAVHAGQGTDTDMARLFFEAGPQRTLNEMEQLLARSMKKGELRVDDPALAAEYFFGLLQGCHHMKVLIGYAEPLSPAEAEHHVRGVVTLFLRAYAP